MALAVAVGALGPGATAAHGAESLLLSIYSQSGGSMVIGGRLDCAQAGCTYPPSSVVIRRGGATVAESAEGPGPSLPVQALQPGDVLVLRSGGADRATHTWQGRPVFEAGIEAGSPGATGRLTAGFRVTAAYAGPPTGSEVPATSSSVDGETFRMQYAQPLGCGQRVSVLTGLSTTAPDGTPLSISEGRGTSLPGCQAAPAPDPIAVVTRNGDALTLTGPNSRYRLVGMLSPAQLELTTGRVQGAPCATPTTCATSGIRRIDVRLQANGDRFEVEAKPGSPLLDIATGAGGDTVILRKGPPGSRIALGDGNDFVNAQDGLRETITCGAGRDGLTVDAIDVLGAGCVPGLIGIPKVLGTYDANARGIRVDLGRVRGAVALTYELSSRRSGLPRSQVFFKKGTIRVPRAGRVTGKIGVPAAIARRLKQRPSEPVLFQITAVVPTDPREGASFPVRGTIRRR